MYPASEAEPVKKGNFKTVRKSCRCRYHQISYLGENTSLKIKQFLLRMYVSRHTYQKTTEVKTIHPVPPYKIALL